MKRYFLLVILLLSFMIPFNVRAADLKLTYDNDFKKDYSYVDIPVLPSYDSNGKIDGHLFFYRQHDTNGRSRAARSLIGMFKLDLNNKLVFDKSDDEIKNGDIDYDYVEDDETGLTSIVIIGYDEDEEIIFETKYGGNGDVEFLEWYNSFNSKGKHDGYLLFLSSASTNLKSEPGFILLKIGLDGKIIWEKNVNEFTYFRGTLPYVKNNKLDSYFEFSHGELNRVNCDTEETVWKKEIGIDASNINFSYDESGEIDGILLVGMNDDYQGTIIKYDLAGNLIFNWSYNSFSESVFTDVISSMYVDGKYDGYIVTAALKNGKTFIIKYDYSGEIVWSDKYSDNQALFMNIIRNYDSSGRPNGYLLYQTLLYENDKKRSTLSEPYYSEEYSYKVAKYTYDVFPVEKELTSEGIITVNSMAYPGEMVRINVIPREGYTVKRIVVMDESGKEIEVSKDGTFIMPEGKVTVTAIYNRISNPKTVSACYTVLGIILLISIGTLIVQRKQEEK